MNAWNVGADASVIEKTVLSLKKHGIEAVITKTKEEAKQAVLAMIPDGSEVMTMTSESLEALGIGGEINSGHRYDSVRNKLTKMDRKTQGRLMQQIGAAPLFALGSVHAVTTEGELVIASNTGSQLPAYAYGSDHVVFVVGFQKIVSSLDEAMKRVYEYVLPLETERAKKAYGVPSAVNKLLIIKQEVKEGRMTVVFVQEPIGF